MKSTVTTLVYYVIVEAFQSMWWSRTGMGGGLGWDPARVGTDFRCWRRIERSLRRGAAEGSRRRGGRLGLGRGRGGIWQGWRDELEPGHEPVEHLARVRRSEGRSAPSRQELQPGIPGDANRSERSRIFDVLNRLAMCAVNFAEGMEPLLPGQPNPSKQDLLDHATELDKKYGSEFDPPISAR